MSFNSAEYLQLCFYGDLPYFLRTKSFFFAVNGEETFVCTLLLFSVISGQGGKVLPPLLLLSYGSCFSENTNRKTETCLTSKGSLRYKKRIPYINAVICIFRAHEWEKLEENLGMQQLSAISTAVLGDFHLIVIRVLS